ncbi:uncharacterized protein PG998_005224 [Apiospora kogelbergensis]|uniref:uncharacterized protein n=1 Tax=Apiospora kogelbergensis TaxID=1337665 RepID=UPI003131B248
MNKISALLLFFALAMATAERGPRVPRETGSAAAPARAPGPVSVLVPTTTAANTWVNAHTCGWVAGVSSYPWTCDEGYECATNTAHIVGCASGTYSPLFSACVDYSAAVAESCEVANTNSGCWNKLADFGNACSTYTNFPACGKYLWTGVPARSMYRCFPAHTVITMIDEPQFVVDSKTRISSGGVVVSPTATPSSTSSGSGGPGGQLDMGSIVGIAIGAVLGFFFLLAALRFAWSFRGDSRSGSGNRNDSTIELVNLPQPRRQQQQQQQHGC